MVTANRQGYEKLERKTINTLLKKEKLFFYLSEINPDDVLRIFFANKPQK
jgi:hypothetical protein